MDVKDFRARLRNTSGPDNQFTALCPAHDDHSNSLSVGLGKDGRILINCFTGCDVRDIVDAMGLTMADLKPARRPSVLSREW